MARSLQSVQGNPPVTLRIFPIRHHGVGFARALVFGLLDFKPDLVLIEGPSDAQDAVQLLCDPAVRPPIALLVFEDAEPKNSAVYPFTMFSPEWIALQYARANGVKAQFIDLPFAVQSKLYKADQEEFEAKLKEAIKAAGEGDEAGESQGGESGDANPQGDEAKAKEEPTDPDAEFARAFCADPLGTLARIAGEDDPARWDERMLEECETTGALFPATLDVMTEIRATIRDFENAAPGAAEGEADQAGEAEPGKEENEVERTKRVARKVARASGGKDRDHEPIREAHMRNAIRKALKSGAKRIAVVCGAWHGPVLDVETTDPRRVELIPKKKDDDKLLAKLPKVKTQSTLIPWTNTRLARRSGYGAGIEAPAYLEEIWLASDESKIMSRMTGQAVRETPDALAAEALDEAIKEKTTEQAPRGFRKAVVRTICRAARILREDGRESAAARALDAYMLADALAATRGRSFASLDEIRDSVKCAFCDGDDVGYATIKERLEIGSAIGTAPTSAPKPPLARDIEKTTKALRLKREVDAKRIDVDLRQPSGLAKSVFFRRLILINAPWGTLVENRRTRGTFHETWNLQWKPEFEVDIIDASRRGSTLLEAASNTALEELAGANSLAGVVALVERVLPAKLLDSTLDRIYAKLRDVATLSTDVSDALEAIPPLVRSIQIGSARQDFRDELIGVFNVLFDRATTRLKEVCVGLNEDDALKCALRILEFANSIELLNDAEKSERIRNAFATLSDDPNVSPFVSGWMTRTLYERDYWSSETLECKIRLNVSQASPPETVSQWLQGFLFGTGASILYLEELWRIVDSWLMSISGEVLKQQSPMLRRAFSYFTRPEHRKLDRIVANLRRTDVRESDDQTGASWDDPRLAELKNAIKGFLFDEGE